MYSNQVISHQGWSMMNNDDDALLLTGLAENLDGTFPVLVERYTGVLWRYCRSLSQFRSVTKEGVDDVVQQTFINAYFAMKGYTRERLSVLKLKAWLFRIASNECFEYLNRHVRGRIGSLEEMSEQQFTTLFNDPWKSIERQIELGEAISTLPPLYGQIVQLRFIESLSIKEIVLKLGIPEGTVKNRIFRARKLLRGILGDCPPQEESEGDKNDV